MPKKLPPAADQPITWKLVEIDKTLIRPNANNPKIRKEKGFEMLSRVSKKFGIIFDGIVNFDNSLIDGHSRLEMYPEGMGNYFRPSRQLTSTEETELNALYDLAKAGDPDLFMIEQIVGEEMLLEWEGGKPKKGMKIGGRDTDTKFPLVPQFDEKHESIVIICTNSLDTTFIKNFLGIDKSMSYKNKMVKETSIVTAKRFIDKVNAAKK